jgi:hypothetical protein
MGQVGFGIIAHSEQVQMAAGALDMKGGGTGAPVIGGVGQPAALHDGLDGGQGVREGLSHCFSGTSANGGLGRGW